MKNLKNLGISLSKKEQKEIIGGKDRYMYQHTPCQNGGLACYDCLATPGGIWNAECNRCDIAGQPYIDDGNCGQFFP